VVAGEAALKRGKLFDVAEIETNLTKREIVEEESKEVEWKYNR
jgi:hypothetical protein